MNLFAVQTVRISQNCWYIWRQFLASCGLVMSMVDNERSLQCSPEIGYNAILLVYFWQGGLFISAPELLGVDHGL